MEEYGITTYFRGHTYITKEDIERYFLEKEPGLKDGTLRWRIYHLKERRILRPVKRGVYSLDTSEKRIPFDPPASRQLDNLYRIYFKNFKMETCALWSTEWLAQFMELQPTHNFIVFEIDKELTHPLFFHLQEEKKEVFLDPDAAMMRDYVLAKKNPAIVRPLITRAPLQKTSNGLPVASLEKILVDLFCDQDLFISYQGTELKNIYTNAWKNYLLNLSTLINYARRRKREKSLMDFLRTHIPEMYKPLSK